MEFDPTIFTAEYIASVLDINKAAGNSFIQFKNSAIQGAAVLMPLVNINGLWHFLLTKRSESVNVHKGQVSFPGGRIEQTDENPVHAALREAQEEIGIDARVVKVLGSLRGFYTISNFWVIPVVGLLKWPTALSLSEDEVSKAFLVPISWFLDEKNFHLKEYLDPDEEIRQVIYYRKYDDELIWGITAQIIYDFLNIFGQ